MRVYPPSIYTPEIDQAIKDAYPNIPEGTGLSRDQLRRRANKLGLRLTPKQVYMTRMAARKALNKVDDRGCVEKPRRKYTEADIEQQGKHQHLVHGDQSGTK